MQTSSCLLAHVTPVITSHPWQTEASLAPTDLDFAWGMASCFLSSPVANSWGLFIETSPQPAVGTECSPCLVVPGRCQGGSELLPRSQGCQHSLLLPKMLSPGAPFPAAAILSLRLSLLLPDFPVPTLLTFRHLFPGWRSDHGWAWGSPERMQPLAPAKAGLNCNMGSVRGQRGVQCW